MPKITQWNGQLLKHRTPYNGMDICGIGLFLRDNRTEIPIQNFIDLIEDKIVAWRLVEDGFKKPDYRYMLYLKDIEIQVDKHFEVFLQDNNDCKIYFENVKTYSDLLTLIRLL